MSETAPLSKNLFLPVPSQTDQLVTTSYGNSKLKISWSGFATGQVVSFDGIRQAFSRVDLITENQDFFIPRCPKTQGIWGLAYSQLQTRPHSRSNAPASKSRMAFEEQKEFTLFDAIRREKGVPFTVQLCPRSAVEPEFSRVLEYLHHPLESRHAESVLNKLNATVSKPCSREGHLWLGGYPTHSAGSDVVWTPLYKKRYYEVNIHQFLINGNPIQGMENFNSPRTVVDTGTKDIVLSIKNLSQLLNALWRTKLIQFDALISKEHEKAFWLERAQLNIPRNSVVIANNFTLAVEFQGNDRVLVPIENILNIQPGNDPSSNQTNVDWIKINWTGLSSTSSDSIASTVLGNSFLRGKTVIFDRGKEEYDTQGRIGFADAAACCRASSGSDVDILLSFDSISKAAVNNQSKNEIRVLLFVLVTVGFVSTAFVFVSHYACKKNQTNTC